MSAKRIACVLTVVSGLLLAGCASQGTRQANFYDYDRVNMNIGPQGLYENRAYRGYERWNNNIGPSGPYEHRFHRNYEKWVTRLGPTGLYEPEPDPNAAP